MSHPHTSRDVRVECSSYAYGPLWRALADSVVLGQVRAWVRPDGRTFLYVDQSDPDAMDLILESVEAQLHRTLHVSLDERDKQLNMLFTARGYQVNRTESTYSIPVARAWSRLDGSRLPPGIAMVPADEPNEARLRELDDRLRQDVPGTDGWTWHPDDFREETFESDDFDPQLYWIAKSRDEDRYIAIARLWNKPHVPRLGLLAVLPPFRRQGVARALLLRGLDTLKQRGVEQLVTETDDTNVPMGSLLKHLGARRTGRTIELAKPR